MATQRKSPIIRISFEEARKNFYFRMGDIDHIFETGQRRVPEWKDKSEGQVLIDRVLCKTKPVAEIIFANTNTGTELDIKEVDVRKLYRDERFTSSPFTNSYGMNVIQFTTQPDATLEELLKQRTIYEQNLVVRWTDTRWKIDKMKSRRVSQYFRHGGFGDSVCPVSTLESALLYGYPLDLAGEFSELATREQWKISEWIDSPC